MVQKIFTLFAWFFFLIDTSFVAVNFFPRSYKRSTTVPSKGKKLKNKGEKEEKIQPRNNLEGMTYCQLEGKVNLKNAVNHSLFPFFLFSAYLFSD